MAECDRVQFRLAKARFGRLSELSGRYGVSPNLMAKQLIEAVLDGEGVIPEETLDDLLVIRAGIEAMFSRSAREDELADAVEQLRARRETALHLHEEGGNP